MNIGIKAEKIKIYTASAYYKKPKRKRSKLDIRPYDTLPDEFKEWVLETFVRLIENTTPSEQEFEQRLINSGMVYEKQVFFRINGNNYFLDFYIPKYNIAFEIDGGYHKHQRKYDRCRDNDFRSIGVKTKRVPNSRVSTVDIKSTITTIHFKKRRQQIF